MIHTPNIDVKNIIKDIKFNDFIDETKLNGLIVIKMKKLLLISGELNDNTFNECITDNILSLENDIFERYIIFCKLFRTKYKELNLSAHVSENIIIYSHK